MDFNWGGDDVPTNIDEGGEGHVAAQQTATTGFVTIQTNDNTFATNVGYSADNMKQLLDLDMKCRRIWGVTLRQSDLKYNKTFDPK